MEEQQRAELWEKERGGCDGHILKGWKCWVGWSGLGTGEGCRESEKRVALNVKW